MGSPRNLLRVITVITNGAGWRLILHALYPIEDSAIERDGAGGEFDSSTSSPELFNLISSSADFHRAPRVSLSIVTETLS